MRGTIQRKAEHKEKPANPDISRVYELLRSGADGGIRTRTLKKQGIFLPHYVAIAAKMRCGLDYVLALPSGFRPLVYSLYTFAMAMPML